MFFTKAGRDQAFEQLRWKVSAAYDANCKPLNGSVNLDCWSEQQDYQLWLIELNDYALLAGKIIVPVLAVILLILFLYWKRALIENSIVDGAAAAIKTKRKAGTYMNGLKTRIDQKTNDS